MTCILKNIEKCIQKGDRVNFAFQGGEPTLSGLDYFLRFTETVSKWDGIRVSYALQTNALYIDEEWCEFLKNNKFLVGVSFDILPEFHDSERVDVLGKGTYARVLRSIELLKKNDIDFNVLCTLTDFIARHPQQVWRQLSRLDIEYVQFTPCLGELNGNSSVYALTPKRFASFYTEIFTYWYNDYRAGKYRSIKFFDDVVNQIILGKPTSCGMDGSCRVQLVVEADGSVYPCDFYCLDECKLGNLTRQTIDEILASQKVVDFLKCSNQKEEQCKNCTYVKFCGGNCRRMRKEICIGTDKSFCGYRKFLDNCGAKFVQLAREVVKKKDW